MCYVFIVGVNGFFIVIGKDYRFRLAIMIGKDYRFRLFIMIG
jgi:hypothetical protein